MLDVSKINLIEHTNAAVRIEIASPSGVIRHVGAAYYYVNWAGRLGTTTAIASMISTINVSALNLTPGVTYTMYVTNNSLPVGYVVPGGMFTWMTELVTAH